MTFQIQLPEKLKYELISKQAEGRQTSEADISMNATFTELNCIIKMLKLHIFKGLTYTKLDEYQIPH